MKPGLTNRQLINVAKLVAEEAKKEVENNERFKSKPEDFLCRVAFTFAPEQDREEALR
jgi:hypothetical protein